MARLKKPRLKPRSRATQRSLTYVPPDVQASLDKGVLPKGYYIVSIAGPKGGGRQVVKATNKIAAARIASKKRFPGGPPLNTDYIVTPSVGKQGFYRVEASLINTVTGGLAIKRVRL